MAVGQKLRAAEHLLEERLRAGRPVGRESLASRIERLSFLDGAAGLIQKAVSTLVPSGTEAKDVLSGTWLGHPLHPALTDVVIGSWTSAFLLDALGGRKSAPAAELLVGAGVAAAVPTAASGLADWAELRDGARRVGVVHGVGNSTALTLQVLSLRSRRRGSRARGIALSAAAMGVSVFSAWLGGHLSYRRGVGVDQTVFDDFPAAWTPVANDAELEQGQPVRRSVDGAGVLLVRQDGNLHALADRCSHRGCSLAEGKVREGTITCACHGSTYTLDGALVRGPATAPQPALDVRVREGRVEVRRRSDG